MTLKNVEIERKTFPPPPTVRGGNHWSSYAFYGTFHPLAFIRKIYQRTEDKKYVYRTTN